jgi:hypothetical protein
MRPKQSLNPINKRHIRERNRVQRPEGILPHNSRERATQEYMLKRLH